MKTDFGHRLPDVVLDRYLANDLPAKLKREIEAQLAESVELRERLEKLRAERDAFLASEEPQRFAHQVAVRVASSQPAERPRRWKLSWILAPAAVAVTGLVIAVTLTRIPEPVQTLQPRTESLPAPPPSAPERAVTAAPTADDIERKEATRAPARYRSHADARAPAKAKPAKRGQPVVGGALETPPAPALRALEEKSADVRPAEAPAQYGGDALGLAQNAPAAAAQREAAAGPAKSEATSAQPRLVVRGALTSSEVGRVIENQRGALRRLWPVEAETKVEASPEIRLRWVITASGEVTQIRVVSIRAADSELTQRLLELVGTWRFSPARDGGQTDVTYTFDFVPR